LGVKNFLIFFCPFELGFDEIIFKKKPQEEFFSKKKKKSQSTQVQAGPHWCERDL
jgi:hypothetical protein